jgi:serine/threonine protein kinase
MGKYCCFFCPSNDYSEKSLNDHCPSCGRTYGFVLEKTPHKIQNYEIISGLGRGFYGSTYIARAGRFRKVVVKVTPVEFYKFFKKPSFEIETERHNELAQNANHIIGIEDSFSSTVTFSDIEDTSIECYVSVLEYVEGSLLRDYLDGTILDVKISTICQITADLLTIRTEFESNQLNHNDLHAENLIVERLPTTLRRQDAMDDSIRVKAIDLGSISDESKSSNDRDGDLTFIAKHVDTLLSRLMQNPDKVNDREYRIAIALESVVNGLQPYAFNVRRPNINDIIDKIRDAFYYASSTWKPWRQPLTLKTFGDHYNAQTLDSWNVPQLLVDPNNEWFSEVRKSGPQIITGMRGCGKTMLLRSLDFHARAVQIKEESPDQVFDRIKNDGFVGLFVSAQRLLDLREQSSLTLEHSITRMYVSYSLQAVRALLHLKDLRSDIIHLQAHDILGNAIADYLPGADNLRESVTLEDLERQLERILALNLRGNSVFTVESAAALLFPHLAEKFRKCSSIFETSIIYFLLDDVSTRYLDLEKVSNILSSTLFQSPHCAFKFTSEWQTIELGLRSPGRNHPIRVGRDLDVFDLGGHVSQTIKNKGKGKGKEFVLKILEQRVGFYAQSNNNPKVVLGDVSLEQIATEIASSNRTSQKRKEVYHGLSCLANICVGDIGDVIKLYEEIQRHAKPNGKPVPKSIQAECFQSLSSQRLYDLSRRDNRFKNHAISFAEAAHELLVRSMKLSNLENGKIRLRQYSSVYVRITSEDEKIVQSQIDILRDLIDAGVFVYAGGSPRTKTKDSNPMKQFKLSYRKIYGLASFIGLADRDRFELSGEDLQEWLNKPSNGKDILIRNQILSHDDEIEEPEDNTTQVESDYDNEPEQLELEFVKRRTVNVPVFQSQAKKIEINIEQKELNYLKEIEIGGLIGGLGFEDRALESNRALSKVLNSQNNIHLVRYPLSGHSKEILKMWSQSGDQPNEHDYEFPLIELPRIQGLTLVDVTGLTKPIIFKIIRRELSDKGRVLICHATAKQYYPLQDDISNILNAGNPNEPRLLLENLTNILKGESGEYAAIQLLENYGDPLRKRALIGFSSSKHERLFSMLDQRDYDFIELITPKGKEPWKRVAKIAADFVCKNQQFSKIEEIDISDLGAVINYLDNRYLSLYSDAGADLELALTGSKMQAVAAAVLSSQRKVSQAWYISPKEFDHNRFSSGLGEIRIYDIRV